MANTTTTFKIQIGGFEHIGTGRWQWRTPEGTYTIKGSKGNRYAAGDLRVYFNTKENGKYATLLDGKLVEGGFAFLYLARRRAHEHYQQLNAPPPLLSR